MHVVLQYTVQALHILTAKSRQGCSDIAVLATFSAKSPHLGVGKGKGDTWVEESELWGGGSRFDAWGREGSTDGCLMPLITFASPVDEVVVLSIVVCVCVRCERKVSKFFFFSYRVVQCARRGLAGAAPFLFYIFISSIGNCRLRLSAAPSCPPLP